MYILYIHIYIYIYIYTYIEKERERVNTVNIFKNGGLVSIVARKTETQK